MHGNSTNLPAYLTLSQTCKDAMFFFLSYVFSSTKLKNKRVGLVLPRGGGGARGRWPK
jgi:hypothetical protein